MVNQLTLLTWPDYISPLTLEGFESEFGVKINLEIVPSAVELIERMKSANEPAVDVLCPPDYAVRELGGENLLYSLDHAKLPNMLHLEKRFRNGRAHDAHSQVSIVKDWGTTGFMYRTDMIYESPSSWADFWRLACSAKNSGKVTVLDAPGEVIGAALKMKGHSYNASSAEDLADAHEALLTLKPHLLDFETNYKPLLISGAACLALGWNGDAAALISKEIPVQYVVPSEGSQIWEDDWAIAAHTRNAELAHQFLNFVMRPEVAAQEAKYTRYATGNTSALAMLDADMRNDSSTYPPREILAKLEAGMPIDEAGQKRREDLWAALKAK